MRWLIRIFYTLATLGCIASLWLANGGYLTIAKHFYPYPYRAEIERYSRQFQVDPLFVATIIREESRFRPEARSSQGATGLMQLMPQTGTWGAQKLKIKGFKPERLSDPTTNIQLGCWYLHYLFTHFGSAELVLAAYNGGESNTPQWAANPELHAFPETKEYIRRNKATYEMYRKLYGNPGDPVLLWVRPTPIATHG